MLFGNTQVTPYLGESKLQSARFGATGVLRLVPYPLPVDSVELFQDYSIYIFLTGPVEPYSPGTSLLELRLLTAGDIDYGGFSPQNQEQTIWYAGGFSASDFTEITSGDVRIIGVNSAGAGLPSQPVEPIY